MAFFLDKFIPQNVVTAFINETLKKELVFGKLIMLPRVPAQLTPGASYKVPGVGSINIKNYTGADIDLQNVTDTEVAIAVDQSKYFNINLDMVDTEQQAKDLLPIFTAEAAYELANVQDAYIASVLDAGASLKNTQVFGSAAAVGIDESTVIDFIAGIKNAMDAANVPKAGRFLVLPSYAETALASANVVTAATTSEVARATGYLRNFFGFEIYMSNNLVTAADPSTAVVSHQAVAGINRSAALVQSVQNLEFYKPEKRFSAAAKGLNVYGAKVLRGDATVSIKIYKD